jgi:two-component system nitrate/nitrite response regulator NarL
MPKLSLVLADDHPLLRTSLERTFKHHPDLTVLASVADGREALRAIRDLRPDVAVLDQRMPSLSGLDVASAAREEQLATRVLLLSGLFEADEIRRALELGVAGLVSKTTEAPQMVDAVLSIGRGEVVFDPSVPRPGPVTARAGGPTLTLRERQVLEKMAAGRSGPQIAEDLHLSLSTIKSHTESLYGKLGVSDRGAAVAQGLRRGLVD